MPYWIKAQKKLFPLGQPIRSDGPLSHLSKKGTPTLGGALIIACLSFSTILWTSNFSKFTLDKQQTAVRSSLVASVISEHKLLCFISKPKSF